MKAIWLANLNEWYNSYSLQKVKISGAALIVMVSLTNISCSGSDDAEIVDNDFSETPVDKDPVIAPPDPPDDNEPEEGLESLIVYTDIEPDFKGEGANISYDLDINNDQVIDFTINGITDEHWPYLWITTDPDLGNGVLATHPFYAHPVPLHSQENITSSGYYRSEYYSFWAFFTIGDCFGGETGCYYDWQLKGDKYLGVRIKVNGLTHYGWVKMNIESTTQWVVMDYAFNAVPNRQILAGQIE